MDKAHKIKDFLVGLELYFQDQCTPKEDKITIIVIFLKEYALMRWIQYKEENEEVVSNLD